MARIAIAGFLHETNTFSPIPTNFESFASAGGPYAAWLQGDEMLVYRGKCFNRAICGFIATAEAQGHSLVPLAYAAAEPSNQVSAEAFEQIAGAILNGLREKGPFDALFLDLHGAMVVEDFRDGETELLRRARTLVGGIPIAVSLDLHGNIARESFELASVMAGYRTYPHVDVYETGVRCANALNDLLNGRRLFKAFRQVPFLMPLTTQSSRTEPCCSLYARVEQLEQDPHIASCSIMASFAPADLPHTGPTVFAYADTQAAADATADDLLNAILDREAEISVKLLTPREAVAQAMRLARTSGKPVILADVQDNAGAGGTSDTPWLLEALVGQNAQNAALGLMFDPQAALAAHQAGEGAVITLALGGKLTPGQNPFKGTFTVKSLHEGEFTATGPMFNGMPADLGKMANLQIGGVEVVVASSRTQANDQSFFRQVGIEPAEKHILALKSSNHYRADFEPIAAAILPVDAPGAFFEDAHRAPYRHLRAGVRLMGGGKPFTGWSGNDGQSA